MLDIGTIVTILSSLNFIGRFEVARNESLPYFCLCGINDTTNYIYNDSKTLQVGIEYGSEFKIFQYNISCPEILNATTLATPKMINTTELATPELFNMTELATTVLPRQSTAQIPILNCSSIDTDKLTYNCKNNELYQYLYGFMGVVTFIVGLYIRPDLIWTWFSEVIYEQYYGYQYSESSIRTQL